MNRITLSSRINPDGVLRLDVPVGTADADRDVQITIEPIVDDALASDEWEAFVRNTAGAWQGDFERSAVGELEERDLLP